MKKGISLIVLVITIIVMVILAAAVVIALNNTGIINKANQAVEDSDLKQVQDLAAIAWAEAYSEGIRDAYIFEVRVEKALTDSNVSINDYTINASANGVSVTRKNETLNQYGFYYNTVYRCEGFQHNYDKTDSDVVFRNDGSIEIETLVTTSKWTEGGNIKAYDFAGNNWLTITNLEYNKLYSGTGTANAQCSVYINEDGVYRDITKILGESCVVSNKQILIGGTIPVDFSEDGKSFVFDEQTFTIVE